MKTVDKRAITWLLSDDTGASSTAICAHMLGECSEGDAPSDSGDLGRCLRLLELIPEWGPRISEMGQYGPSWAGLIEEWAGIVELYNTEGGLSPTERPRWPETYQAIKLAIASGYRNDPRYECGFDTDGRLTWSRLIAQNEEEVCHAGDS